MGMGHNLTKHGAERGGQFVKSATITSQTLIRHCVAVIILLHQSINQSINQPTN